MVLTNEWTTEEAAILHNLSGAEEAMFVLYGENLSAKDFADNVYRQMTTKKGICAAVPNTKESWHLAAIIYRESLRSRQIPVSEHRQTLSHIKRSFGIWNSEIAKVIGDPEK